MQSMPGCILGILYLALSYEIYACLYFPYTEPQNGVIFTWLYFMESMPTCILRIQSHIMMESLRGSFLWNLGLYVFYV